MIRTLVAAGLVALTVGAHAQTYPVRPVRLVVPFPAGSATDQVARLVGQQLQEALKQPFVVENKPGAQGSIAAGEVARAAPDGYTLLVTTNTPQAANVSLFKKLAYDPVKDFAPVARIGTTSFMLMVRADSPLKTFKEFLADARAKPGKLSAGYGSSGSQVSLAMTTWAALFGGAMLALAALFERPWAAVADLPARGWLAIAYIGIFGTVVAFLFFSEGVRRIGPSRTAIFINFVPVFGVAFSALFLGEPILASMIVGGGMVIGGVLLTTRPARR